MKTKIFTTLLLVASLATVQAQDLVIGNFEDGIGSWGTWGAPLSTVENPAKTGVNTSDSVALLDQSTQTWSGMALWVGENFIPSNIVTVHVDVYSKDSASTIKLQMDNPVDTEQDMIEIYKDISANSWTTLSFDISTATYKNYQQIALQAGAQTLVYFDNIVLIEGEEISGGDTLDIEDFELPTSTTWSSWNPATMGFEENIDKTGINPSDSVAYIDQTTAGAWVGSIVRWDGNSFTVRSFHVALVVDVYPVDSSATIKLHMDNSVSSAANYEQYINDVPANTWTSIVFNTEDLEAYDYQQIAFQTDGGLVYFDNVRVVLAENTPIASMHTDPLSFSVSENTLSIFGSDITTVSIYSISGQLCAQSNGAIVSISSLPKGTYAFVVNNGKASGMFVK